MKIQLSGFSEDEAWLAALPLRVSDDAELAIWHPDTPKPEMRCVAFLPVVDDPYRVAHPALEATTFANAYAGDSEALLRALCWLGGCDLHKRPLSNVSTGVVYLGGLGIAATQAEIGGHTTIDGQQFAGRAPGCILPLRHGAMSDQNLCARRHARLRSSPEGLWVEDLGSTNGTFVNGLQITESTLLKPGHELGFASALRYWVV